MRHLLGACLLLAGLAPSALAQEATVMPEQRPVTEARVPNFLGATGLLYLPSAYVQNRNTVTGYFQGNQDFLGGGLLAGVADRFEIGFNVVDLDDDLGGDTEFLLNAKLNLVPERMLIPGISVGIIDTFDEFDIGRSWYVVASKYFTRRATQQRFALKGHVGWGGGFFDHEPFGGAELFFTPAFSAMAEVVNGDVNLGARFVARGFAATLALFDLDSIGGSLSYSLRFR